MFKQNCDILPGKQPTIMKEKLFRKQGARLCEYMGDVRSAPPTEFVRNLQYYLKLSTGMSPETGSNLTENRVYTIERMMATFSTFPTFSDFPLKP